MFLSDEWYELFTLSVRVIWSMILEYSIYWYLHWEMSPNWLFHRILQFRVIAWCVLSAHDTLELQIHLNTLEHTLEYTWKYTWIYKDTTITLYLRYDWYPHNIEKLERLPWTAILKELTTLPNTRVSIRTCPQCEPSRCICFETNWYLQWIHPKKKGRQKIDGRIFYLQFRQRYSVLVPFIQTEPGRPWSQESIY